MPRGVPKAGFRKTTKGEQPEVAAKVAKVEVTDFVEKKPSKTFVVDNARKFSASYAGEKIDFSGFYQIVVTYPDNGFTFKIPSRGFNLESRIAFQKQSKWSTFVVERIDEKEYNDLSS
jgi:hypothetical protein